MGEQQALITAELAPQNGSESLAAVTPVELLRIALNNHAAIDVIERLAALEEKFQARGAEVQFNEAMSKAQTDMKRVAPDLDNPQTHSRYASYAALDKVLRPIYSRHGFSLSFDTDDCPKPDAVRVVCYLSLGAHTRKYKVDMPADGKGAKGGDVMTKTHATGAAMTYGMRYLLKFMFNVAIGAEDADGNDGLAEDRVREQCEWLANAGDLKELQGLFKNAYTEASEANDKDAMFAFIKAKDARRKELQ